MRQYYLLLSFLGIVLSACNPHGDMMGLDSSLELSTTRVESGAVGEIVELTVASSYDWWTIGEYDWIKMSIQPGTEVDKVTLEISSNNADTERSAIIVFQSEQSSKLLTVVQQSGPAGTSVPEGSRGLKGTIIGSKYSVDYLNGYSKTTAVNTKAEAFDGNMFTYFSAYDSYQSWIGLDLGEKHVITKVGWAPRVHFQDCVELALFEGANNADFSDALPIHIVKEPGENLVMHYADVSCSRGFRYVRFIAPNNVRCTLAELEFYGYQSEGDDSKFYQLTNLPTVVINTPNDEEITSKEYEVSSNVYIISDGGTNLLSSTGTGVRGRGNSTWSFPKKPYRLKFSSKQRPLGAPASAKKWTLLSNYGDKSLLRNITAFEVSRRVGMSYTPFCHPVDVIVNGDYRGCYQLCDQVEAAAGRVEAKDGYLIEIDAYAEQEESWFRSSNGTPVTIKHPDEDDITSDERSFISSFFNLMENAVFADNYTDPENGYRKYLDLDSFLRNFIVGEFCGNVDAFWSVYMYKDSGDGKLYTGPIWDHDLSLDNDYRLYPTNDIPDFVYVNHGSTASSAVRRMVTRIVKEDPQAKARLIELWEACCGEDGLGSLSDYIDENARLLQQSQELNFKRWDILDQIVHMNFQALGTYEAEVGTVKDYVTRRVETLDELLRR